MAVIVQLKSGDWGSGSAQGPIRVKDLSAQIRRRGLGDPNRVTPTTGKKPAKRVHSDATAFGHMIDPHLYDLHEVGKPLHRSKHHVLRRLKEDLGLAKEGAGPATLAILLHPHCDAPRRGGARR